MDARDGGGGGWGDGAGGGGGGQGLGSCQGWTLVTVGRHSRFSRSACRVDEP